MSRMVTFLRQFRIVFMVALAAGMASAIPIAYFNAGHRVAALPGGSRTIGLVIDGAGWHDVPGSSNPTITIYERTSVVMFLKASDSLSHQLRIFTPTPINSPTFSGTVIQFSFTISQAGAFGYCDITTGACGLMKITFPGDVNGDFNVNSADTSIGQQYFGQSLNASWNSADQVYLDGRVDYTDLNIVTLYFGTTGPWPAPYNPDVNHDGVVNIIDVSTVAAQIGKAAPAPFNTPNQGPDVNYDNTVNIIDLSTIGANYGCNLNTCS